MSNGLVASPGLGTYVPTARKSRGAPAWGLPRGWNFAVKSSSFSVNGGRSSVLNSDPEPNSSYWVRTLEKPSPSVTIDDPR